MRILTVILSAWISSAVFAAEPPAAALDASAAKATKSHNFEDLLVQGKYHFSGEAVVTVEEDTVLDSLLGIRKDFKDRLEQSSGF